MPTAFVGQNGATLNQDTHIEVNGCSDTLSIISHSISKRTLKVSVYAPGAGEVKVSGAGLTSATKGCSAKEAVSFTLRQKKAGNLSTKLKIVFTPSKGTRQSKALRLKFRLFLRCNLDRCAVLGLRSPLLHLDELHVLAFRACPFGRLLAYDSPMRYSMLAGVCRGPQLGPSGALEQNVVKA